MKREQVLSAIETMLILIRSMGAYTHDRILSPKEKAAYLSSARACIEVLQSGVWDMNILKAKIDGVKEDAQHVYPKRFMRHGEHRAHELAAVQALEIVNSIEARFLTGQSDDGRVFSRVDGHFYQDTKKLFE